MEMQETTRIFKRSEFRLWIRFIVCLVVMRLISAVELSAQETAALEGSLDLRWVRRMVLDNYSMITPPFEISADGKASAVLVYCMFQPKSITSISVKTMDFDVDLDMNIYWVDLRLVVPPDEGETPVVVPRIVGEELWWPRIKFRNCKGCNEFVIDRSTHVITMASPKHRQLLVEDRKVFKFICTFDLSTYPFDTQTCFIRMESLTDVDRVRILFTDEHFEEDFDPNDINVPPEFTLVSYSVAYTDKCASSSSANSTLGTRDCIEYLFTVKRSIANHLMLIYGPSLLIVMLSWISFWLDVEAAPPRVALGLTSLLTLATQFNAAQNNLPSVAAIKAIDIWMFCCIFMVFASLIEFAVANFQHRLRKSLSPNTVLPAKLPRYVLRFDRRGQPIPVPKKPHCLTGVSASPADRMARVMFPLTFLVFNIIYWSTYA